MNTNALKKFAQQARRQLREQVGTRLEQVLRTDSVEIREKARVVAEVKQRLQETSKAEVIDRVAYTWFNRFCALRFMDVNHYTRIGIVSPVEGFTQPEMLQEAKQGVMDETWKVDRRKVLALLTGQAPSRDPQQEVYRLLLVGACNAWHAQMPFLFPEIEDYTELLMPDDLLSENSVLHAVREVLTPETCEDVEVIGWLYQFYISEKKDEVFEALKQNQKIEADDIPAATQLFTPHWIVRYLVENSLGRLWMLNHPESRLGEQMAYYIRPGTEDGGPTTGPDSSPSPVSGLPSSQETDFLRIASPEDIKLCDPACGSGHILTYAFDLLYAMYAEQGYDPVQIPRLILEKNLYGIEIDERAGTLAAFALTMKARAKDRRFFQRAVSPQICVLENVSFTDAEIEQYVNAVGRDLFTEPLKETLGQFEQAKNFGSLIRPNLKEVSYVREVLAGKHLGGQLFLHGTHERVLQVLKFAEFLAPRYHVTVANPPYMGSAGLNVELKRFCDSEFPDSKPDLYSMFIERNLELLQPHGYTGMITMQSWMFLSSFETLREKLLQQNTFISMAHLGTRAFDTIGGAIVSTTSFILKNSFSRDFIGSYLRLVDGKNEAEKEGAIKEAVKNPDCGWLYYVPNNNFGEIPGSPIAYWISKVMLNLFSEGKEITEFVNSRDGLTTGNNELFIRYHWEVSFSNIGFGAKSPELFWRSKKKFAPLIKGGSFRKWYGNLINVITYNEAAYKILAESGNKLPSRDFYFRENLNWTRISSPAGSFRYTPAGCIFESASLCAYSQKKENLNFALAAANSALAIPQLDIVNPTTNLLSGYFDMLRLPEAAVKYIDKISLNVEKLIEQAKSDWDAFETSWDFTLIPILHPENRQSTVEASYQKLRNNWHEVVLETKRLEEENNRIFVNSAELKDEISPELELIDVTLTCNPVYRYGNNRSNEEYEEILRYDTMKEFISYAVGCMFGRYSLDQPGLILANQGETLQDYLRQVPHPTFLPDEDNAIPILEGEWFPDDIAERFKKFLRVTFGDEHFDENLAFIEDAIGRDIRSYFFKDFYNEHVKMYKKRPIYWLFSSPKGSFNVLIYMHRYRPDTLSVILNGYLRAYREKLTAHQAYLAQVSSPLSPATQSEKTKALKEADQIHKVLAELKQYEDEVLYPLATKRVEIDLDDGVKVNYAKFAGAVKRVAGL